MSADTKWTMPEWMEPYREMFQNTGGNSVEDLMRDRGTNGHNNVILSALIISVDSQVTLLARLHAAGVLPADGGSPWRFDKQRKCWTQEAE